MAAAPSLRTVLLDLEARRDPGATAALGRRMRVRAGQGIFAAGDPADLVVLLVDGALRVVADPVSPGATSLLLRAPGVIGDRDVLAGVTVVESVHALVASELLLLSAETFHAALDDTVLVRWILQDLALRASKQTGALALAARPVQERVLNWALGARRERSPLDEDTLALLVGGDLRSVRRAVAVLLRKGLLARDSDQRIEATQAAEREALVMLSVPVHTWRATAGSGAR